MSSKDIGDASGQGGELRRVPHLSEVIPHGLVTTATAGAAVSGLDVVEETADVTQL